MNNDFGDAEKPTGEAWDRIERIDEELSSDDDSESGNPRLANALTTLVDWLIDQPEERLRILDNRVFEDLYGGRWVASGELSVGVQAYGQTYGDPVKLNFARNAVDFVQTKVCAETPAVVVSARSGGYRAERRADRLNRYIDRLIDSCELMSRLPRAALTALQTGTAIIKTYLDEDGRPQIELVPSEWIHVDPGEGRNGDPCSLYERRPVSRRSLLETWVDQPRSLGRSSDDTEDDLDDEEPSAMEAAILSAPPARDPLDMGLDDSNTASDIVDVYEGWTKGTPSRPGRHVVCVNGFVLLDEDWIYPRFPHAFFGFDPPPPGRGFWAQGLLSHIDEAQAEIDFLLAQVSEQIRLARLKVFVERSSDIIDDHLIDSDQGRIIHYDGQPPTFSNPPTVSVAALQHIQWLVTELYQTIGMSEQGASSQRPAGVNSGRAILFFHDFQTKRFVELVKRYGDLTVAVIDRLLDRAEEGHIDVDSDDVETDPDDGKTNSDSLRWSEVRMDRSDFTLKLETVSPVPRSYAGRTQRIEQLIAQGQMPEGYWTEYLSDPNAWRAEHRAAAQAEHIEWLLDQLTDPDAEIPDLNDKLDFGMALEVLGGEVLTLVRKKADQEIIDRVEDFYDRIVARREEIKQLELTLGQQQAEAQAMMGGVATPNAPGLDKMGTGGIGQAPL